MIPEIRKVYLADMSKYTNNRQREAQTLQNAIKKLEEKELNSWRAFTEHGMRPQIFEQLPREYEDKRQRITAAIDLKPPFNYLDTLAKGGQNGKRGKGSSAGTKKNQHTGWFISGSNGIGGNGRD